MDDHFTSSALSNELERLAEQGSDFVARARGVADDVELWLCRTIRRGFTFHEHRLVPMRPQISDRAGIRVMVGGRMGVTGLGSFEGARWQAGLESAMGGLGPEGPVTRFGRPITRRPTPFTFDPDLADALSDERAMQQLAHALCDNTHHEAQRTPGLERLSGGVVYTVHSRVVATSQGVVAALHGDLDARLRFNGVYSELFHQSHLPDSFLPLAMLGARAWLNMPRRRVDLPKTLRNRSVPVLLHPRLIELLLRRVGEPMLSTSCIESGASPLRHGQPIAGPEITLADDSTLDGLSTSRAFDDEGTPTRRIPILLKGRLTQTLITYQEAARRGLTPTGSGYRRAQGGLGVEAVPVSPRLGCVVMEPGDVALNGILGAISEGLLVYEVAGFDFIDHQTSKFQATIASAVTLGPNGGMIPPGRHRITGHLFSIDEGPSGLLSRAQISRELYDTGGAILPYCLAPLEVS